MASGCKTVSFFKKRYLPHLSTIDDPEFLRRKMEKYGVGFSQLDAAFPLSGKDGPIYGVPYVMNAMRYAKLAGCPRVCTTDGLDRPEGLEDHEAMSLMKRSYEQLIALAEAYEIDVTIEIHGYFTTNIDRLGEMLEFVDSSRLALNLDTGNSFIAGGNPVDFVNRYAKKVSHVHLKDVSRELAEQSRGSETGIAMATRFSRILQTVTGLNFCDTTNKQSGTNIHPYNCRRP